MLHNRSSLLSSRHDGTRPFWLVLVGKASPSAYVFAIALLLIAYWMIFVSAGVVAAWCTISIALAFWQRPEGAHVILFGGFGLATLLVARALLMRIEPERHRDLDPLRHERLYTFAIKVADRVGARRADSIAVVPGWEIYVYESCRFITPFSGRRVLVLGLFALHSLSIDELRSILAHEFAHFRYRDTTVVRYVYLALLSVENLVMIGQRELWPTENVTSDARNLARLVLLLPASAMLKLGRWLLDISVPYRRLAEMRADRVAAQEFGPTLFVRALMKVSVESAIYRDWLRTQLCARVEAAPADVEPGVECSILRTAVPAKVVAEYRDQQMARVTESNDTHPCPRERITAVKGIGQAIEVNGACALSLLDDVTSVERGIADLMVRRSPNSNKRAGGARAAAFAVNALSHHRRPLLLFLVVASLAAPVGLVLTGVLSLGDPSGAGRFMSMEAVIGAAWVYYLTKKKRRGGRRRS